MSMLALLGFLMICTFMFLIMTKRMSPMVALMLVPIVFGAVIVGLGLVDDVDAISKELRSSVTRAAPTAIMLCFAILYFGTMIDAGLFDPLIKFILKMVKGDPVKVALGTCLLTTVVSLDGDGATTYLTTCSALLLVHRRIGINPAMLPTLCACQTGIMNLLPWGGPTGRVMASLDLTSEELFLPLIPGMIAATIFIFIFGYFWGLRERRRLGWTQEIALEESDMAIVTQEDANEETESLKRPKLFFFNLALTMVLLYGLMTEILPLMLLFMMGTGIALVVNYPKMSDQQKRVEAHAASALPVISLIFAAGIMMGVMSGTQMVDHMAQAMINMIPESMGAHMAFFTALLSIPGTFFLTNDAFYFGIVPVLAKAGAAYGVPVVEIGRASLLGPPPHTFSPLTASTWLLVGLSGVSMADLQKYGLIPAIISTLIFIVVGIMTGAFVL